MLVINENRQLIAARDGKGECLGNKTACFEATTASFQCWQEKNEIQGKRVVL
jgi:hypothetical protein